MAVNHRASPSHKVRRLSEDVTGSVKVLRSEHDATMAKEITRSN